MSYLSKIIENKRSEVKGAKERIPLKELKTKLDSLKPRRNFKGAITRPHHINLIAEIKKASPSAGVLREDFDPVKIAQVYKSTGAHALSVLTDEKYFGGNLEFMRKIRGKVDLPILRKDFMIDEYQIYESAVYGADAILLIADILSEDQMKRFNEIACEFGLACIAEVHSEEDMGKALNSNIDIIGINNRDLRTFKIDIEATTRLIKLMPKGRAAVSESGITTHENVMYLKSLGVNAVLIGEAFMRSQDIGAKVKEIMGVA